MLFWETLISEMPFEGNHTFVCP